MYVLVLAIVVGSITLSLPLAFWLGWTLGKDRLTQHEGSAFAQRPMTFAKLEPQRHVKPV